MSGPYGDFLLIEGLEIEDLLCGFEVSSTSHSNVQATSYDSDANTLCREHLRVCLSSFLNARLILQSLTLSVKDTDVYTDGDSFYSSDA